MKTTRLALVALALGAAGLGAASYFSGEFPFATVMNQRLRGQHTVADRLVEFGPAARARWQPFFDRAKVAYPPTEIVLLGLKREQQLEVYARSGEEWRFVRALPIVKASGIIGPKLREGDRQVPEGFYGLESLNPNSSYHLSLRVSYPNAEDKTIGAREGRTGADLGGDIMIHGGAASIGCLAMGDQAAEDLFVLAADTGHGEVQIVLSPLDFRVASLEENSARPLWLKARYGRLEKFMKGLPPQ